MKRTQNPGKSNVGHGWALVRPCPRCDRPEDRCRCREASRSPASDGSSPVIRLQVQKRRGKPVTVLDTEGLPPAAVRTLGKELKILCGSGGTTKGLVVEVQGDHRERIRSLLQERAVRVRG